MNFDYTDEQRSLRQEIFRALSDIAGIESTRKLLDGEEVNLTARWRQFAELGWVGIAISENDGGSGLGYTELAGLNEEVGRTLSPLPVSTSLNLLVTELQQHSDSAEAKALISRVAGGESIGTFAFAEGGMQGALRPKTTIRNGRITGIKWPVLDGAIADAAMVTATDEGGATSLCLVDLNANGVTRSTLDAIDNSRAAARLEFDAVPALELGGDADIERLFDRGAVLTAFEQIGGADRCLEIAVEYAGERRAFGQPIGTYQGVKHKLARAYVGNEIARSNAYKALCALEDNDPSLPVAAAVARISALEAYAFSAAESLHVHGGMGFTWEADLHLYLRRQQMLALFLGGASFWKPRLARLLVHNKLATH